MLEVIAEVEAFRDLGEMSQESDDVVPRLPLDLVDAGDIEGRILRLGPDRLRGILRDHAELRQCIRRMRLDLEPDPEPRLRLPDRGHLRAGIAGNHRELRGSWAKHVGSSSQVFFTPRFNRSASARPPESVWACKTRGWALHSV